MRKSILLISLLLINLTLPGQTKEPNVWKTLSKVKIEKRFDENLQFEIDYPTFSDEIKALDGKEITLEGFMIPLDELQGENYFVLSLLPFNNCFFCGGAGPETVMEIFSIKEIDFTEKKIKVKGKLTINADDPMRLMYILKDAKEVD